MYKTFTVRKFDNKINESFRMLTQSLLEQNQVFTEAKENFQFCKKQTVYVFSGKIVFWMIKVFLVTLRYFFSLNSINEPPK